MIGNDFFPTPLKLTRQMVEKIGSYWEKDIKYILEPSAGKGDLIENLKQIYEGEEYGRYKTEFYKKFKIDVVEKEPWLTDTLRGKGFNVVGEDFLEFSPPRYYDLVLANFPFKYGCRHLLKAIEIQERIGGRILCLVNSETIRNTYSNDRKHLKSKLEKYNAEVEFVKDAFVEAERTTDVEVAIVYINIPMNNKETMFEKEFKRENPTIDFKNLNALTTNMNKLQQLVFEYDLVINSVTKLFQEELRVNDLLKSFGLESDISICNRLGKEININDFVENTNQKFWDKFIRETEFENKLPSKLKDNFRSNMQQQRNIRFSMENIKYFYDELIKSIPDSYEENCNRIFDELTIKSCYTDKFWDSNIHYYNGWKTNSAYKIGKKSIIRFHNDGYLYNIPEVLMDLVIVFENLSGVKNTLKYGSEEYKRILNGLKNYEKDIDCYFFSLDAFKKGSIHLKYKDLKLVEAFNVVVSRYKNWLPDSFGKKPYSDMTEEEKDAIKNFGIETVEEYQVYSGQKDYLRLI